MMKLTRRSLLQASAVGSLAAMAPRLALATPAPAHTIVVVFLFGGCCPLQTVVPYSNADYYLARPVVGIPAPGGTNPNDPSLHPALDLDGYYGLNPGLNGSMAKLQALFKTNKNLAVVYGTGLLDVDDLSHFHCQQTLMAADASGGQRAGWGNRHFQTIGISGTFQGVGIGNALPFTLAGPVSTVAMNSIDDFAFNSYSERNVDVNGLKSELDALYLSDSELDVSVGAALSAVDELALANPGQYGVMNGAVYPDTYLGNDLKGVAQLIRAQLGIQIIQVAQGGYDHHDRMNTELPPLLDDLAASLSAFNTDLGSAMDNCTVVVMTEFGRRLQANDSGGADHGEGSLMLLMGGAVNGGVVYGDKPDISGWNDYGNLAKTTDSRRVLSELLAKRCGETPTSLLATFPGYVQQPYLGIIKSA